jgi:hypothetical protein
MRKSFFIFSVFTCHFSNGQVNVFPTTGNVGIVTTSPQSKPHYNKNGYGQTVIFANAGDSNKYLNELNFI